MKILGTGMVLDDDNVLHVDLRAVADHLDVEMSEEEELRWLVTIGSALAEEFPHLPIQIYARTDAGQRLGQEIRVWTESGPRRKPFPRPWDRQGGGA